MAMEIFKLVGSIFVDNKAADESLSKTDKKAEGIGKTLLSGLETAGKWGAAVAGAAVAAGTAIYNTAIDTAEAADEIDKMSQKLGWSREAYQEWDYVLGQAGVDVNSMQTGLKTLTNKLDDAKNGSESAMGMFEALGLSLEDISNMSREDLFAEVIEGFQGMEDSTERAALANDLFGKSGQELTALFNESVESTEALKTQFHDLGLAMSDEAIDSGVQLHDTMDTLKRSFGAVGASIGTALIPIVQELANFVQENMPVIKGLISSLTPVITQLASALLPPMMQLISSILPVVVNLIGTLIPPMTSIIEAVLPVIIALLDAILPIFTEIVELLLPPLLSLLEPLINLLTPIIQLLSPILSLLTSILTPIISLISGMLAPLTDLIVKLITLALGPVNEWLGKVASTVKDSIVSAVSMFTEKANSLKVSFESLKTWLTSLKEAWGAAWDAIKEKVTGIWSGITDSIKGGVNGIISKINGFISRVNSIKIPDWVPSWLGGGKSLNISSIPYLEEGGVLERGQTGFLEGNGAEAVVPLDQNKKWINAVAEDMQNAVGGEQVTALLTDILEALENIAGAGVYINGEKLVGAIAPSMNQQLGRMAAREARA